MKRLLSIIFFLYFSVSFAKIVKFSVNMTGQTINPNGVHVSGDFQIAAGYASNWDSESTLMTKEGNTEIYSVVVNIPAFRKYEYKFVNGDQFYEVEVVPEKSRVGFDFIDNRWIYIDSLNNDTTILPAYIFAANAPEGKLMLRFKVNMKSQSKIDIKGIHIAGSYNNWQYNNSYMYSFDNVVYEYIAILDSSTYEYRYVNGDIEIKKETVNGFCINVDGNRFVQLSSDTVLEVVCYQKCTNCTTESISKIRQNEKITIYPNPAKEFVMINFSSYITNANISIIDFTGKKVLELNKIEGHSVKIDIQTLKQGIYQIKINNLSDINNSFVLFLENK